MRRYRKVKLERDFNFPEMPELMEEYNHLQGIADKKWSKIQTK